MVEINDSPILSEYSIGVDDKISEEDFPDVFNTKGLIVCEKKIPVNNMEKKTLNTYANLKKINLLSILYRFF